MSSEDEQTRSAVVGGVDTHKDLHVAAVVDHQVSTAPKIPRCGHPKSLPGRVWFRGSADVVIGLVSPPWRTAAALGRRWRRDERL